MDADGDADVLGAVYSDDEITWWENVDGFGEIWVEHLIAGDLDRPNSLYTADIDGDGDADVLGAGFGGEILCWKNVDGSGETWSKHLIDGYFEQLNRSIQGIWTATVMKMYLELRLIMMRYHGGRILTD